MKIAFFSDTHLGHRRFGRVDELSGLNVRERDVMRTFEKFLKSICDEQPDVVLHGGDFFDMVRPGNHTILKAFSEVSKFQRQRDGSEFLVVAGNHEVPRVQGTGCILDLFQQIEGVQVFWNSTGEVIIERGGERVSILCVPHGRFEVLRESLSRDEGRGRRLLLAHGVTPNIQRVREADFEVEPLRDLFDLILLGNYHVHRKDGKNAVYVGSTDYTSANIWEEAGQPKGWILLDTTTMEWKFHRVEPVRAVYDFKPIDASQLNPTEVYDRMLSAMEEAREKHKWREDRLPIVRQRILNAPEGFRREVPFDLMQTLRSQVFEYSLETPSQEKTEQKGEAREPARPLEESWTLFAERYELPADVDRGRFLETGLEYLKEARDAAEADSS